MVARGWGEGGEELVFNGYRISVVQEEESWRWKVVMVVQQCKCPYFTLNCTLKNSLGGKFLVYFTTIKNLKQVRPKLWSQVHRTISTGSAQSLSHVRLSVTPWTAAHQASLSITNSQSSLKLMTGEKHKMPRVAPAERWDYFYSLLSILIVLFFPNVSSMSIDQRQVWS